MNRSIIGWSLLKELLFLHISVNIPGNAVIHRRGRLNLPENDLLYAFGRIQSAPTRYVNEMYRKSSSQEGMKLLQTYIEGRA